MMKPLKSMKSCGNNIEYRFDERFLFLPIQNIKTTKLHSKVKHLLTSITPHFENNSDFYA